ncbi:MAG: thioredoxin family protein [Anaerolineae bacterium]|nr:thioredoxin family protein [Anaerolineae bacterium]
MLERTLVALAIIVLVLLARYGIRRLQRRAQQQVWNPALVASLRALGLQDGPAVVAFSTPECAQCQLLQKPALNELQALLPGVQILQVDATEHPEVATSFSVITVPTTVVLDRQQRPMATNNGYAPAARLYQQLDRVMPAPEKQALVLQN